MVPEHQLQRVLLLDSNWAGHHPTYFKEFAAALLELGYEVHAICPQPEEVLDAMGQRNICVESLTLHRWNPPPCKVWPRRFAGQIKLFCANRWMARELNRIERQAGKRIDLVFFACLYDGFLRGFPRRFHRPWVGLYLQVRAFRMQGKPVPFTKFVPDPSVLFGRQGFRGLGILDEGAADYLRKVTVCSNIEIFPDLTDESPPRCEGVAAQLREFAGSRPIVGVAGHLQPSKGLVTLARVAEHMSDPGVVFAFVGEMMRGVYSEEEERILARVFALPHVFTSFERVPDGPLFNGVLDQFSVVFAAYENFPHSSNMLTKAALLRKPVVVSDGYLMAERVREFGLGAVVLEGDVNVIAGTIADLLRPGGQSADSCRFEAYLERHSAAMLRSAIARLVSRACCEGDRSRGFS